MKTDLVVLQIRRNFFYQNNRSDFNSNDCAVQIVLHKKSLSLLKNGSFGGRWQERVQKKLLIIFPFRYLNSACAFSFGYLRNLNSSK